MNGIIATVFSHIVVFVLVTALMSHPAIVALALVAGVVLAGAGDAAVSFIGEAPRRMFLPVPDNDDEPLDTDRVHADLALIAELMERHEHHEAYREVCRLIDVVEGRDEAAATDARWVRRSRVRASA